MQNTHSYPNTVTQCSLIHMMYGHLFSTLIHEIETHVHFKCPLIQLSAPPSFKDVYRLHLLSHLVDCPCSHRNTHSTRHQPQPYQKDTCLATHTSSMNTHSTGVPPTSLLKGHLFRPSFSSGRHSFSQLPITQA